jgi:hypothetical protein
MRRILSAVAAVILLAPPPQARAIDVAEDEVRKAPAIDFVNYDGPRELAYNADDVRDIGRVLAIDVSRSGTQARYGRKYSVVRAFDPAATDKLGADIMTIEPAALADHINTIRYILQGYLEASYRYAPADASLLAVFITYYNAVHRGDIAYVTGTYQPAVLQQVSAANVGLARSYQEWAGTSRILVPLTEKAAARGPGSLDTSALTDKKVVEELQKSVDRGVPERKDMVALKERETGQAQQETAEKRATVEQQKTAVAEQQKALDEQKKATAEAERVLAEEKRKAETVRDPGEAVQKQQDVARREAAVAAAKQQQAAQQKAIDEKKADTGRQDQAVAREEAKVEAKKEEIAKDKTEVKRDERIVEAKTNPEKIVNELETKEAELARMGQPIAKNRLYYLKVKTWVTDGHYANELYAIDALTGEMLYKAPEKPDIVGHQYTVLAEGPTKGVLVLTMGETGREAHYLTLLDLDTLKPTRIGSNAIFHRSFVEKRGDFFYAIDFRADGDFRLGKYDASLNQVAESADKIDPDTVFHIYGDLIFVNSASKNMLVLKADDLTKVRELKLP